MILMAYTGTPSARGSGVDSPRVTWAAHCVNRLSEYSQMIRCTPIT